MLLKHVCALTGQVRKDYPVEEFKDLGSMRSCVRIIYLSYIYNTGIMGR